MQKPQSDSVAIEPKGLEHSRSWVDGGALRNDSFRDSEKGENKIYSIYYKCGADVDKCGASTR